MKFPRKRWSLWCRVVDKDGKVLSDNPALGEISNFSTFWTESAAKRAAAGNQGMVDCMVRIWDTGRYQQWYVKYE